MKRIAALLALPALLSVVWLGGRTASSATAQVSIDTDRVAELRGLVIEQLGAVGAAKTGEDTSFDGGGRAELTFRVPPAQLEEALTALGGVGGQVTHQKVELDGLAEEVVEVESSLESVGGCLGRLADLVNTGSLGGVPAELTGCQERVTQASQRLEAAPHAAKDAVLAVHISRTSTTNMLLVVAVALMAVALGGMAIMMMRPPKDDDDVYDLRDRPETIPLAGMGDSSRWN